MSTKKRRRGRGGVGRELKGRKFDMLLVGQLLRTEKGKGRIWECRCDCGEVVEAHTSVLTNGTKRSCGCLAGKPGGRTDGRARTPEYRAWKSMLRRCYDSSLINFTDYGGRGIQVCDRWRSSFEAFLEDMGKIPRGKTSIDRIDNDGNYEPGNVRWADAKQQARNRRNSLLLEYGGEELALTEWSERTGIPYVTLRYRIRAGWSPRAALETPPRDCVRARMITFRGETLSLRGWSKRVGLTRQAITHRIDNLGWSIERALTEPSRRDR